MNISIVSVGKLKEKYLKMGIDEYVKRLGSYAKIDLVEVADEKAPETLSDAEMDIVKRKEGERILAKINDGTYVIALATRRQNEIQSEEIAAGFRYPNDVWKKQNCVCYWWITWIT